MSDRACRVPHVTNLSLLVSSIGGGQGQGLVLGLALLYQPLHRCSILSTQCAPLQTCMQ